MQLDEIIKGCKENDRQAQRELYRLYAPMLMRVCRRYAYSDFEADDYFQEAFVHIFKNINKYKEQEGKGNIEAWLYRVTVNIALKQLKKQLKHRHQEIENENSTTSVVINDNLTIEELHHIIDQLPPGQKAIFNLYAIDGYNHKEIAEMMNIEESASRSQLTRAREALKRMHEKHNREKISQQR